MSIRQWPASERPREKLLQRGAEALSDAELLAIFLRTGVRGKSAVELARDMLTHFGSLRALLQASLEQFCEVYGLGAAKYCQLQASLEMAQRHLQESIQLGEGFTSPAMVRQYLTHRLRSSQQEQFLVLFLDNHHRLLADEVMFKGTINQAAVYPREVVKRALERNAAALILAHNHPSGIADPSQADIDLTHRLNSVLSVVEVRVLDHFIVGDGEVVSMAERGLIG
ncbi:JAB domain-containing protein [Ectothiorhodospiraceae bacterium BW-2]|nr:JAB domain-containing protein [Ectothiorhodospiraceae bacterium BW-2]